MNERPVKAMEKTSEAVNYHKDSARLRCEHVSAILDWVFELETRMERIRMAVFPVQYVVDNTVADDADHTRLIDEVVALQELKISRINNLESKFKLRCDECGRFLATIGFYIEAKSNIRVICSQCEVKSMLDKAES